MNFQPGNDPKSQMMMARKDPNVYVRHWVTPLMKTCTAHPGWCCYATWCGCCASYNLRKQALHGDMTRYICCNGGCPCSGRCGEQNCPECCLCAEAYFCFGQSVATTRFMIQDELRIQTTACDNCLIGTMIALQWVACIFHIVACIVGSQEVAQAAHILDVAADIAWCTVCACMQTQHRVEMNERDKGPGGAVGRPAVVMAPPQQVMGNPGVSQGVYAGPPGPYQQPGYPPQGYPPQGAYPGPPGQQHMKH